MGWLPAFCFLLLPFSHRINPGMCADVAIDRTTEPPAESLVVQRGSAAGMRVRRSGRSPGVAVTGVPQQSRSLAVKSAPGAIRSQAGRRTGHARKLPMSVFWSGARIAALIINRARARRDPTPGLPRSCFGAGTRRPGSLEIRPGLFLRKQSRSRTNQSACRARFCLARDHRHAGFRPRGKPGMNVRAAAINFSNSDR